MLVWVFRDDAPPRRHLADFRLDAVLPARAPDEARDELLQAIPHVAALRVLAAHEQPDLVLRRQRVFYGPDRIERRAREAPRRRGVVRKLEFWRSGQERRVRREEVALDILGRHLRERAWRPRWPAVALPLDEHRGDARGEVWARATLRSIALALAFR